jgi:hypothetical protein
VYAYKNNLNKTVSLAIKRTIINSKGIVVGSSGGTRMLKGKESFSYKVEEKLGPQFAPGSYRVSVSIFDTQKKLVSVNSFDIEIINCQKTNLGNQNQSSGQIKLLKSPSDILKPASTLTYTYEYKNLSPKTEKVKIIRQFTDISGKTIISADGFRTLKPNQAFSFAVKEKLPKILNEGSYKVRIIVRNSQGAEVARLDQPVEIKK